VQINFADAALSSLKVTFTEEHVHG
jgi:hypothetical protein